MEGHEGKLRENDRYYTTTELFIDVELEKL